MAGKRKTTEKTPNKRGLAVLPEVDIEAIIERISSGSTLKKSCELSGVDYVNVVKRIHASESLKQLYACAREGYTHYRVQEMHDIAADKDIDPQRARLMVDCIKWEAARVIPKQYGDKIEQTIQNPDGSPITIAVNFIKAEKN